MISDLIQSHSNIALLFSGGIDSIALLHLMRAHMSRITVIWLNTGDAFPETIAQMASLRDQLKGVARFMEVHSSQPMQIALNGYPSDVHSAWNTSLGQAFTDREQKFQSPINCCNENRWKPMQDAVKDLGATLVITGQRQDDPHLSQVVNGQSWNGADYYYPLASWTREDVLAYLKENDLPMPDNYAYMSTSLDCQHCTAFAAENAGKVAYMKAREPGLYSEFKRRIDIIVESAQVELNKTREIYCGSH